ncbi:DUF6126 family protein [Streptomyces sp. NPDC051207]
MEAAARAAALWLWVRLIVYIAVGHVFAAFVRLLFEVGAE